MMWRGEDMARLLVPLILLLIVFGAFGLLFSIVDSISRASTERARLRDEQQRRRLQDERNERLAIETRERQEAAEHERRRQDAEERQRLHFEAEKRAEEEARRRAVAEEERVWREDGERAYARWLEDLAEFRQENPVLLVCEPPQSALENAIRLFATFNARATGIVPPFARSFFDEAGEPKEWVMTPDDLRVETGMQIAKLYDLMSAIPLLPYYEPLREADEEGEVDPFSIPEWNVSVVWKNGGEEADLSSEASQIAYAEDIAQARKLKDEIAGFEKVLSRSAWAAREAVRLLAHLQDVPRAYSDRTDEGVAEHFKLALEMQPLPLPTGYHWEAFYNGADRLLQINQRVVHPSFVLMNRKNSKRALAKKDEDYAQRRVIPAIALHIAQHCARNDLRDDVDTVAVNCWVRYYHTQTGKLRDAFVASLSARKNDILEIDINNADPLAAYRALGGAFAYALEDVVPIEPSIRLDREDSRFVEGKAVLSGMAQGQNLATMDWQDFEHLIRELLAKEFSADGDEVKITQASRDRGVDAVVFNPDPLRGGKVIVQAKRYNGVVEVSAVRDLWGTVDSENAVRGILVTTSWFGRDAKEWAADKRITLIDGQNLLSMLAKHGFQFTIQTRTS